MIMGSNIANTPIVSDFTISTGYEATLTETATLTATSLQNANKNLTQTITSTDTRIMATSKLQSETLTNTEIFTKAISRILTENKITFTSGQSGFSNAFVFDGSTNYISVPNSASLTISGPATETVECFFYPTITGVAQTLIQKGFQGSNSKGFLLRITSSDKIEAVLSSDGTNTSTMTGTTTITANAWHHAFFKIIRPEVGLRSASLGLDGVRESTLDEVTTPNGLYDSSEDMTIGSIGSSSEYFKGYIDEIRYSNTGRYSGTTYTVPTSPFTNDGSTLALYHCDSVSGVTVPDSSSNANDGTFHSNLGMLISDTSIKSTSKVPFTETITDSDTLIAKITGKTFTETPTISDDYSRVWVAYRTYSELLVLVDGDIKDISIYLVESVNSTDYLAKLYSLTETESFTLSDLLVHDSGKILSDSSTISDSIFKDLSRLLLESVTSADNFFKAGDRVFSTETLSVSDTLIKYSEKILEDSYLLTDFRPTFDIFAVRTENITYIEYMPRDITRLFTDSFTLSDEDEEFFLFVPTAVAAILKRPELKSTLRTRYQLYAKEA